MAKATYGFPTDYNKTKAQTEAIERAKADGIIDERHGNFTVEFVETDEHKENGEYCVVIRTPEEES